MDAAEARDHVTKKIKREADDEDHVFVSPSFTLTTCDAGCGPSSAVDFDGGPLPVEIKPELGDYQHVTESKHVIRSSHDGQKPLCLRNSEIGSVEDGGSSAFSGWSVTQAVKDETHDYMHGRVTQCAEHDAAQIGDLANTDLSRNSEAKAEIRYIENANYDSNMSDSQGTPEAPAESPSTNGRVETPGDRKYGKFETPGGHHDRYSIPDTNDHSNKQILQRERLAKNGQTAVSKIRKISNIDRSDSALEQIIEKYNDNPIMELTSLERALKAAREKAIKVSSNESSDQTSTPRRTKTKSAQKDTSVSCQQYCCSSCKLKVDSQGDLKEHVRIHPRKRYRKLSLLLRNIRTKCSITDEDMFHCQQCGKAYMFASDLNRHMTFHEEEKLLHAETTEMQKRMRRRNTLKHKSDRCKQIIADRNVDHSCQSNKDRICNICWIAFPSEEAFLEHKLHPEKAITGKRYQTGMAAACSTRQLSDGSYANRWTKHKNDANCSHNQTGSFREEQSRDGNLIVGTEVVSHIRGSIEDHVQSKSDGTEESGFGVNPPQLCSSNKPYQWQNQSSTETIPCKASLPCYSSKPRLLQNHTSSENIPWELPLCSSKKTNMFQTRASNETIPREFQLPSSSNKSYVLKIHPSTQTKPCKPVQLCSSKKPNLQQSQTSKEAMPVESPLPSSSNKPHLRKSHTSNETIPSESRLPCSSNKPDLRKSQTSNATMPVESPLPSSSYKPHLRKSHTSNETIPSESRLPCSSNKPYLRKSQTSNATMSVESPLPSSSYKPYLQQSQTSNATMPVESPLPSSSYKPYLQQSQTSNATMPVESPLPSSSYRPYLLQSQTSNATIPREASLPISSNKSYTLKNYSSTQTKPRKPPQLCFRNKPHVLESQTDDEMTPREPPSPCSINQNYLMQNNASHETTLRGEPLPCSSNKSYLSQNHASNVTMPLEAPRRCSSNTPYLLQSHTSTDTKQCEPPLLDTRNKPYLLQSHTSSENTPCPSTKPYLLQSHTSRENTPCPSTKPNLMQNQASNGTLPRKHPQPFSNKKPCRLQNDASNESELERFASVRRELKDNGDNAQSDRGPWDPPAKRSELNTETNGKRKPASNAKKCKARSNVSVATKTNWRSYQPKPVCLDCGVAFNCQTDILTHRCRGERQTDVDSSPSEKTVQRTHTGRNPNPSHRFFCRFCHSGFTYPSNLRKHLGNGSSPRYKCIECSEPFCQQKALEDHVLSRHNGIFVCRLCETFFATGRSLSKHMARHEPEDTDTERFYPEDEGKQNEPSASPVAQTSQSSESFSMQQPPTFPPVSQASSKMVLTETSLDNFQPGELARACTYSAPKAPSPNEPSETLRQLCRAVSEVSTDRLQPSHAVSLPSFASPTQPVRLPHSFRLEQNDPRSSTRSDTECSPLDEPTQPVRQTETRTNGADKEHQESVADNQGYGLQEYNIPFGSATFDRHSLHFQQKRDAVSIDLSDWECELVTEEETAAADRAYVCVECDSWFSHKAQLEAHLLDADGYNIPLYCYLCKQTFLCLDAAKKHVQLHKTDVKKKDRLKKSDGPSSCGVPSSSQTRSSDLCDCIFTGKNEIDNDVCEVLEDTPGSPPERHSVHQRGEIFDSAKTQASCKHTSKRCKSVSQRTPSFSAETQTLSGGAPRKKYKPESGVRRHRCALCPAAFQRASHLKTHIRIHTGERPYPCPDCGSRFKENGGLKRHLRVHTKERPYACEACGKDFTVASSLRRHLTSPAHKWTIRQLQWALDSAAEMERCYGAGQDE